MDVESTQNLEAMFLFGTSFYTYDRPKTNLDIYLQYYPSLSDWGRHRVQLDADVKREFWKDLFVSLNLFNITTAGRRTDRGNQRRRDRLVDRVELLGSVLLPRVPQAVSRLKRRSIGNPEAARNTVGDQPTFAQLRSGTAGHGRFND